MSLLSTVWSNGKCPSSKILYFHQYWSYSHYIWGGGREGSQVFFPHIKKPIGTVFQKISPKEWFFQLFKSMKKATLTRKSVIYKNPLYDFVSFFGFGSKISIAIFSATQNSIWTLFKEFKQFWKFTVFPLLGDFHEYIFIFLCI